MANSVDPDEMAHYEPSHQDLHCLQRFLVFKAERVNYYYSHLDLHCLQRYPFGTVCKGTLLLCKDERD